MKNAYALLGLTFLIVFGGAYLLVERAHAPTTEEPTENGDLTRDNETQSMLTLTSPAFEDGGPIPATYTCDGEDMSPELTISGVPEGTESLVLVMDDPDAPGGTWAHWAVYNIPADTTVIGAGEVPPGAFGTNSWGRGDYGGPCPPSGEHRYIFRLYAISGMLNFVAEPTLSDVEEAAKGMVLESATVTGIYSRNN